MRVLMVAAENGALDGAKVGGIADVIRDLPPALAKVGVDTDVIHPSYGDLAQRHGAQYIEHVLVPFAGRLEQVTFWRLNNAGKGATWLVSHPYFSEVYHRDLSQPFATDATKFALFCAAVAEGLMQSLLPWPDVLHLHDWHGCFLTILQRYCGRYQRLQNCRTVLTVHNIAMQGIRPMEQNSSSLQGWYPELYGQLTPDQRQQICDARLMHCLNPLRAGVNLADKIHVVSPTYAQEILKHSEPWQGFFGGEGLEQDLRSRQQDLVGILNGCDYQVALPKRNYAQLLTLVESALCEWLSQQPQTRSVDQVALLRLQQWQRLGEPDLLITSVGRLTDQKVLLLRQTLEDGRTVLEHLLLHCQRHCGDIRLLIIGSGDPVISDEFRQLAGRYPQLLFLDGYNEPLAQQIFVQGDLFLMPSSFEPCGISQLLAMRAGQLCLVHGVGGLQDTVQNGETGFVFRGVDLADQAQTLLMTFAQAINQYGSREWQSMQQRIADLQFSWSAQVERYCSELYQFEPSVESESLIPCALVAHH